MNCNTTKIFNIKKYTLYHSILFTRSDILRAVRIKQNESLPNAEDDYEVLLLTDDKTSAFLLFLKNP